MEQESRWKCFKWDRKPLKMKEDGDKTLIIFIALIKKKWENGGFDKED